MKEKLINELTLLDTAMYRHLGLSKKEKRFKHEPPRYRNRLYEVYNKLSEEDLQELINIKKGL